MELVAIFEIGTGTANMPLQQLECINLYNTNATCGC
jgi:hypothetical protein